MKMKYIVSYIRPMVNEHLKVNFRTYDLITEFDLERILTGSDDERSVCIVRKSAKLKEKMKIKYKR